MSQALLDLINSRRVVRDLTDEPVERRQLEQILEAGRWGPSGGNRRPHRFVAIQDPETLRLLRMVSPGMGQRPVAIIALCIDWNTVAANKMRRDDELIFYDIGTTAENMLLAAHALGLGAGPVTSFSREAVRIVLNLPPRFTAAMFICLGHPASPAQSSPRPRQKLAWQSLTYWERF